LQHALSSWMASVNGALSASSAQAACRLGIGRTPGIQCSYCSYG
jgi:hypothetical protein